MIAAQWPEKTFRVKLRVKAKQVSPNILKGFIRHDGGPCPVAEGTPDEIMLRGFKNSQSHIDLAACDWTVDSFAGNIIAYEPERSPDFKVEAGKFYITASGERVGPMQMCLGVMGKPIFAQRGKYAHWHEDGAAFFGCSKDDLLCLAADQTSPMVSE